MLKIFKYPLTERTNELNLPTGAQLLDVQIQRHVPTLWALVDPDADHEEVIIAAYATGESIAEFIGHEHIATVQSFNGLVFHYFVVR